MIATTPLRRTDAQVGRKLLAYLRKEFRARDLGYRQPPTRILGGYETLVYAFRLSGSTNGLSGPLILRLMREDHGADHVLLEGTTHAYVTAQGFPAPRVHVVCTDPGVLGSAFLVMDLAPGALLASDALHPTRLLVGLHHIVRHAPRIMADLQANLHTLDPNPLRDALRDEGVSAYTVSIDARLDEVAGLLDAPGMEGLRPGLDWLAERRPSPDKPPVICHGDFHPLNILMSEGKVSGVIDWSNVAIADREYDVARTRFPLRLGPVDVPLPLKPFAQGLRRTMVQRYMRRYAQHHALDADRVRYYEVLVGIRELAFSLRWRAGGPSSAGPPPYADPAVARPVVAHLTRITGVALTLPHGDSPG